MKAYILTQDISDTMGTDTSILGVYYSVSGAKQHPALKDVKWNDHSREQVACKAYSEEYKRPEDGCKIIYYICEYEMQ